VLHAYVTNWDELVAGTGWLKGIDQRDFVRTSAIKDNGILDDRDRDRNVDLAEHMAERFFRNALAQGELRAYVRDPANGQLLQLRNPEDWGPCGFLPGITSDFLDPDDLFCPGPSSAVGGSRRPVFFRRSEFDAWLQASTGETPRDESHRKSKAGAKPGYDWPDVEQFVRRTLDSKGDFRPWDTEWKGQSALEREVVDYISRSGGGSPALSTIRANVVPMIGRWRAKNLAGN
jgi:hypothetical protein